jgi:malonate-semialdehyde dehydrogenase (acetylating)/methylmalonate-semialdehyde dehydrogenase
VADEDDAAEIGAAAARASTGWAQTSLARRTQVLFAFRELLVSRKDELAELITAEHGKVHADALGEIARGQEVVELACGISHLLKGDYSKNASTNVDVYSMREPVGVAGIISPFNFPAMVPMWFFPLAVAAGNAVVLKPSEKDPSASLWMAKLLQEAGLPDGVFNVLQGQKTAVDAVLTSPQIDAVSFVGSTPIAQHVYQQASACGKRVQALGGAKNHMVVLPDADLDAAADAAVNAGYGSAGERCMAISVVVAVDPIGDDLVARIAERTRTLVVGDGRPGQQQEADLGPLVTQEHRDRVAGFIDSGEQAGAKLIVDGRDVNARGDDNGYWLGPTLFDHVAANMDIYTEEIFGPVLSVVRAKTYDEAVELINRNEYGNGTAVFTNDGGAARRFTTDIQVGMVGVNVPIPVPVAYHSFGGWKHSLFGDTHAYGTEGVHFYTKSKVVTSRWPDPATREQGGLELGFPHND